MRLNPIPSQRLRGEAILRLTKAACAQATPMCANALTGVGEVDKILRSYSVVSVEPVLKGARNRDVESLRRLYRILLSRDEDLNGLIADLRKHPDVEVVTPRNMARTFG